LKSLKHIPILIVIAHTCTIPLAAETRDSKTAGPGSTSITTEADKAVAAKKKSAATAPLPGPSSGADLLGMTHEQLDRRFPPPQFKHNSAYSQISWHGTDISTVLDLRYKGNRVSQIRYTTHYGYPRPGTKSNVSFGPWINQSRGQTRAQTLPANSIEAFKKELNQH
jgi:hypothetical protein